MGASRHSAVMGWDLCVMVSCWIHEIKIKRDKREKRMGGGGRTPGSGSSPALLETFQVDFYHPLEHLNHFGIFGKSNVLQI